jgi:predicted Zn-dependent peptidase
VVVAAGNVDHDHLLGLVGEHTGFPADDAAHRESVEPADPSPLAVVTKDTEQAHICWGVPSLCAGHEDRFVLSVMNAILGGGMSSRLFQEVREKRGLAYAVYSYPSLFRETGSLAVYVGTRPSNVEEVVALVREQTALMASDGVTTEELSRAKESIKGQLVLGMESTRNRMTRMGKNEITRSEILGIDEIVARVDAVTAQRIQDLASDLFGDRSALALVGPFEEGDMTDLVA